MEQPQESKTKTIKIRKVKASKKTEIAPKENPLQEQESYLQEAVLDEPKISVNEDATPVNEEYVKEDLGINSYSWEYKIKEKKGKFYFILFLVSLILIFLSFQMGNWFISLFVILGFVLMIQRNTQVKEFSIDEEGVYVQDTIVKWEEVKSFNVESIYGDGLMILLTKSFPFAKIYIPFPEADNKEILFLLEKYSVFKDVPEGMLDKAIKKIIF